MKAFEIFKLVLIVWVLLSGIIATTGVTIGLGLLQREYGVGLFLVVCAAVFTVGIGIAFLLDKREGR